MSSSLFFAYEVNLELEGFVTNWNLNPYSKCCGFLVYFWNYDLTVTSLCWQPDEGDAAWHKRYSRGEIPKALMNVYILLQ